MALVTELDEVGRVQPAGAFVSTDGMISHRVRAKQILRSHPEARALIGRNPWTFALILGTTALQFAIAFALRDAPWWLVLIAAFGIGAFANHALFVMVHECTHRLVFKSLAANRFAGILCNVAQLVPSFTSFERHHLRHHTYLGVPGYDPDLPPDWEIAVFNRGPVGRAAWIFLMPFLQAARPLVMKGGNVLDFWMVFNVLAILALDIVVYFTMGGMALVYLALSTLFSIGGLHPISARWIQEHFLIGEDQETTSYYGLCNALDLNMGFHNEHHDLPTVPWNRLPKLTRIAPEFYDCLATHGSYTRLLWSFVVEGSPAINARLVRIIEDARSGKKAVGSRQ
jgi:sphingolipid 4-desaturase/C4-monooxygenase